MIERKKPDKKYYSFEYIIDISGIFYEDTYFGMCSYVIDNKTRLIREFNKKFPKLKRSRYKGIKLSEQEIKSILKFLKKKKVHMTILPLKSKYLGELKKKYKGKHNRSEKIAGACYFTILQSKSRSNYVHNAVVDQDSWMNVEEAINICKRVAKSNKYDFSISVGQSRSNDFIRISDYIAASIRKIPKSELKKLNVGILPDKIPKEYLDRAFSGK